VSLHCWLAGRAVASDESTDRATHNFLLYKPPCPLSQPPRPLFLFLCQLTTDAHTRTTYSTINHSNHHHHRRSSRASASTAELRPIDHWCSIGRVRHARKLNSLSALGHSYFSYRRSSTVWRTFASDQTRFLILYPPSRLRPRLNRNATFDAMASCSIYYHQA
jgi:hypothetical protein